MKCRRALGITRVVSVILGPLVDDLFRELGKGDDVASVFRSKSELGAEEREIALQLVLSRCLGEHEKAEETADERR